MLSRKRLSPSRRTALYEFDGGSMTCVVKEYWRDPECDEATACMRARHESERLTLFERLGLCTSADRTARILSARIQPPPAIALEYIEGIDLATLIKKMLAKTSAAECLTAPLMAAARCLARIHRVRHAAIDVSRSSSDSYPQSILDALRAGSVIEEKKLNRLARLVSRAQSALSISHCRLIHGDANPSNFIIQPSGFAVAIDLERAGNGDPHVDAGFLVADVIHLSKQYGDPATAGELASVFRHTYNGYACQPLDPTREAFFTAIGLLRIARNGWLEMPHRRRLIRQAEGFLAAFCLVDD